MAENTVVKSRLEGEITLGALGGGAFDPSDGTAYGSAKTYTVDYEQGDLSITLAGRSMGPVLSRGSIVDVLPGDEQPTTLQFSAYFRQGSSDSDYTITDIGKWLVTDPSAVGSDKVSTDWESVYASAAGEGDARLNGLSLRLKITNSGKSSDVSYIVANKCFGTVSFTEGDPDTLQISLTCTDPIPTIL